MPIDEHVRTTRDLLNAAKCEFAAGDELQDSEKMWGAASHAVRAVAQQRGWEFGKHNHLKATVMRLSGELDDKSLQAGFSVAQQFHANFYHGFMEEDDIEIAYPVVTDFVDRMLDMNGASSQRSQG